MIGESVKLLLVALLTCLQKEDIIWKTMERGIPTGMVQRFLPRQEDGVLNRIGKIIVKCALFIQLGLSAGMVIFYFSSTGEFKSVPMNETLSLIVEKARWCNEHFDKKINIIYEDITNDWVSSFFADTSGYVVGFHKPGNLQQNVFFGRNIGPFIEPAAKEYHVYLRVKNGAVECE